MSELEDRISSVLGDPEQLERITNMAKSLMGGQGGTGAPGQDEAPSSLGALFGGAGDSSGIPELDPAMLSRISRLMSQGGADKKQERALLDAMRPYLSEKRRGKMDKAIKIARLAGIAKLALGEFGGEGDV